MYFESSTLTVQMICLPEAFRLSPSSEVHYYVFKKRHIKMGNKIVKFLVNTTVPIYGKYRKHQKGRTQN